MQKLLIILALLCATASAAVYPVTPPVAPTLDETFRGVEFAVKVNGSLPIKYQWYRKSGTKTVKIEDNDTAQTATLELPVDAPAGTYWCEISNAAGDIKSKIFQLATTRTASAPEMKITIKVP